MTAFVVAHATHQLIAAAGGAEVENISPGIVGFGATIGVALATIGIMFAMTRSIRKIDHNERQRIAAVQAKRDQAEAGDEPPTPAAR